jgi:peptidoglycan/xylan/chitin deacetylase (PgdA/CDA1 family)
MKGLFFVLDRKNERGLAHWVEELEKRGIPGVILLDEYTVDNHRYLVRNISKQGFDIGLIFNEGPF